MPLDFDQIINSGPIDLSRPVGLPDPGDLLGTIFSAFASIDPFALLILGAIALSRMMRRLARFKALKAHQQTILRITADVIGLVILAVRLLMRTTFFGGSEGLVAADRILLAVGVMLALSVWVEVRSHIGLLIDRLEAEEDARIAAADEDEKDPLVR